MGKLKSLIIGVAAVGCPFLTFSGTDVGNALSAAAYYSAGAYVEVPEDSLDGTDKLSNGGAGSKPENPQNPDKPQDQNPPDKSEGSDRSEQVSEPVIKPSVTPGQIITKNRSDYVDDTDYSAFRTRSGAIERYNFGKYDSYITLDSGAQVKNCTEKSDSELYEASNEFPAICMPEDAQQPVVLVYHTHTTESFLPEGEWYDADYPINNRDSDKSVVAVGDAICEALAERGVSVVHDCAVHNYPQYTGSYYRSADTILQNLEEYPSIRLVLDIHRDGITNADGSLPAPIAEINGKTAAQFMIISGCDNEVYNIPQFMENYKLACLLQNCAEDAYPGLARPVLFDYRNYNQDLSTGALLIEVGSHGNSLEEAVYTGELLGNIIADALEHLR